jgi:hypothetical protein
MKYRLFFSAWILLFCCGCGFMDTLNRPVEMDQAEKQALAVEQVVIDLKAQIDTLHRQLDAAKAVADATQSEAAKSLVATLLVAAEAAEAALPQVQAHATQARQIVTEMKEKGPTLPLWAVLSGLALPFVTPLASKIPVVGPALGPVLGMIAKGAWDRYATPKQKAADAENEAKAKALDFQLDVTHGILAALPETVRKDTGVDDLLQIERARQIAAGVHATIQPLVAAREAVQPLVPFDPARG